MSEEFKVEIVNPEKSFLSKEDVTEVVIPAFEGEMGILKDHISIISFLKPGIIKIFSKNKEEKFYVEDGFVEFKDNSLSVLTSSIFSLDKIDKNYVNKSIQNAEKELSDENIEDQRRFLISQKIDVLKSINSNWV
ncbi:MAG: ATP synthase epsilon chain [Candidatus Pelagibacterales bacterium]|nr:MAG: ATP synthase epsilon chain [Pelagibacterales bacterium]